jgi:hypothetical protein
MAAALSLIPSRYRGSLMLVIVHLDDNIFLWKGSTIHATGRLPLRPS